MGEVTSFYAVAAILIGRGLNPFCMMAVEQNQTNPYECGSSHSRVVACALYIQLVEL
jgi:hypothetical protein